MRIAVTGSRPDKFDKDYSMLSPLVKRIISEMSTILIEHRPTEAITGMALGIDQSFARLAMSEKIPLTAAIPFKGQDKNWPEVAKEIYYNILYCAKKIVVCDIKRVVTYEEFIDLPVTAYSPVKFQDRNIWMVDQLTDPEDRLLAVCDESPGGTANCHKYAVQKKKTIIRINPDDYRI